MGDPGKVATSRPGGARRGGGTARPEPRIAPPTAARLGRLEPGLGALADQRPFQLGGRAEHLQGEDALRTRSVDRVAEAPEMRAPGAQALDHLKQMGERAGEPVDPHHDQRVPGPIRSRQRASSTRLRLAPEARSSKTSRHPAARNSSSCGSVCCSSVETRA